MLVLDVLLVAPTSEPTSMPPALADHLASDHRPGPAAPPLARGRLDHRRRPERAGPAPRRRRPTPRPLTDTPAHARGAIRNPAGWLLSRLRDWTHPDGTPLPSHADRTAAHRAARDAALRTARATAAAERATATIPPPAWTAAPRRPLSAAEFRIVSVPAGTVPGSPGPRVPGSRRRWSGGRPCPRSRGRADRSSNSRSPSTAPGPSVSLGSGVRFWGTSYPRHRRGSPRGGVRSRAPA